MAAMRNHTKPSKLACVSVLTIHECPLGSRTKRERYHLQRYIEAIEIAKAARRIRPHAYGLLVVAASCAELERDEEAAKVPAEMRTLQGGSDRPLVLGPL
jgi:hypothetical protein